MANGGSAMGGLIAGVSTVAFSAIGGGTFAELTSAQIAKQILASGMVGGVMSTLSGGKFGNGFIAAGAGAAMGMAGNLSPVQQYAMRAAVGGTMSELTGGKFGNGAFSVAASYAAGQAGGSIAGKINSMAKESNDWQDQSCDTSGSCRPMTSEEAEHRRGTLLADNTSWAALNQCIDSCLATTYGNSYELAKDLNPLTTLGSLASELVTGEVTEILDTKLSRAANSNAWGSHAEFVKGTRQLRTLQQFRAFNAGAAVVGAGATGFQAGANAYCAVECR
jgi:hypothetical protein